MWLHKRGGQTWKMGAKLYRVLKARMRRLNFMYLARTESVKILKKHWT